jgi:hypothetical protein
MLHPAFGVMRPEELVFILANSARRGIRELSVDPSQSAENDAGIQSSLRWIISAAGEDSPHILLFCSS